MSQAQKPRLSYCANVHPFTTAHDYFSCLIQTHHDLALAFGQGDAQLKLKNFEYGHGLWIPATLLNEGESLNKLSDNLLQDTNTDTFTLNGFPYQGFHGEKVKANVYQPNLNDRLRVEYLLSLSTYLSSVLREGEYGSISTLPVGYSLDSKVLPQTLMHLNEIGLHLMHIFESTGKKITLGLELEPDGVLQNTFQAKEFFFKLYNVYPLLADYIGVCVDTCHLAVNFESPKDIQDNLKDILISKVQVSSALKTNNLKLLKPFIEPVYLHQTRFLPNEGAKAAIEFTDLDVAFNSVYKNSAGEWRVHYHVPIFWAGRDELKTTQAEMLDVLKLFIGPEAKFKVQHFEIETYTHSVLPDFVKTKLSEQIKNEILWFDQCLSL
jgi:hypothetical protein